MRQSDDSRAGFTLIEVAITLVIGGVMLAAAATTMRNYMEQVRVTTTERRLKDIAIALDQFVIANGRFPCPASFTDAPDVANYGVEILPADCSGPPPAGVFRTPGTIPGTKIKIGTVPVRTLNLPNEDIDDAWGSRFTYAVTEDLAAAATYDPLKGTIQVLDSAGIDVALPAGSAYYVILSAGRNRIGAYTHQGKAGSPCDATTLEGLNCGHTKQFRNTEVTGTKAGPKLYDDYVVFRTTKAEGVVPAQFMGVFFNLPSCPAGWAPFAPDTAFPVAPPDYLYCIKT